MQTTVKRQALKDIRAALYIVAFAAVFALGLDAVYVLTYTLNPAIHGKGPTPDLDLAAYRACILAAPVLALVMLACVTGAWLAGLKLLALGYRR